MENKIKFYKIESVEEIKKSAILVYEEYLKDGYFDKIDNKNNTPISKYKLLKESKNFVAYLNEEMVGTITIIIDGESGIPMDDLYSNELSEFRKEGLKIAEISQLAIDRDLESLSDKQKRFFRSKMLISLLRCVFYFVKYSKVDLLSIAVNPKHAGFYEALNFFEIGSLKNYSFVNNAPAVGKAIFLNSENEKNIKDNLVFRDIIKNPISEKLFKKKGDVLLFEIEL